MPSIITQSTKASYCSRYVSPFNTKHSILYGFLACIFLPAVQVKSFSSSSRSMRKYNVQALIQMSTSVNAEEDNILEGGVIQEDEEKIIKNAGRQKRVSILFCPAQFCVPVDYEEMLMDIRGYFSTSTSGVEIGTIRVASLPRTEWIKVARSLPTKDYLDGNLLTRKTVPWYYDAIEDALCNILAEEGSNTNICIIGHSIGGWIARGYLGGLSYSSTAVHKKTQGMVSSFITLGTPHSSPDTALVDQTRGLLREIEQTVKCSSAFLVEQRGIQVTNVCSTSVEGKFLSTNVEEFVAAASYLPLLGSLEGPNSKGDGIVPLALGLMDKPANHVVIDRSESCGGLVRHACVIPTPWNLLDGYAPSIALPKDFLWYGSKNVIPQWANYIQ